MKISSAALVAVLLLLAQDESVSFAPAGIIRTQPNSISQFVSSSPSSSSENSEKRISGEPLLFRTCLFVGSSSFIAADATDDVSAPAEENVFVSNANKNEVLPPSINSTKRNPERNSDDWRRSKQNNDSDRDISDWKGPDIPKELPKLSELVRANNRQHKSSRTIAAAYGVGNKAPKTNVSSDDADNIPDLDSHRHSMNCKDDDRVKSSKRKERTKGNRVVAASDSNITTKDDDHHNNPAEPWRASYMPSSRTQKRIQSAAHGKGSAFKRATKVIQTLLDTPPEYCNESNVVCALTLSAKILGPRYSSSTSSSSSRQMKQRSDFRDGLLRVLDVLHDLVNDGRLNTRQLSNAAWAIAKHYTYDPLILPPSSNEDAFVASSTSGGSAYAVSEVWDLGNDDDMEQSQSEKRVVQTLDTIAQKLIEIMASGANTNTNSYTSNRMQPAKLGELCMACWAFATVKPRKSPPGWELPPRNGKMMDSASHVNDSSRNTNQKRSAAADDNLVAFEKWEDYHVPKNNKRKNGKTNKSSQVQGAATSTSNSDDIAYRLFDEIAQALVVQDFDEKKECFSPSLIQQCSWKELSNLAWSYAHRGHCSSNVSEQLMLVLAEEATWRLDNTSSNGNGASKPWRDGNSFLPRDISQIAWALGSLQADNYRLSDALSTFVDSISSSVIGTNTDSPVRRPLEDWQSADLVQLAVALAHGRIDNIELMKCVYEEAVISLRDEEQGRKSQKQFHSWELTVLLWVQARLYLTSKQDEVFDKFANVLPGTLLQRMETTATDRTKRGDKEQPRDRFGWIGLGAQEQANLAWSLTVLEKHETPESIALLRGVFASVSSWCANGRAVRLEHAHQLWQAMFLLRPEAVGDVPNEFCEFLQRSWNEEKARRKISSARHESLSQTLGFMGVAHYNEHDEDIDVAIVLKGDSSWTHTAEKGGGGGGDESHRKVAVEFDGPNHFTRPPNNARNPKKTEVRALGHTVLKYRLLKRQGWTVVRVPYFEYDKIPFWASMERQRYLQRLLKTHANIRFSDIDVSEYKAPVPNRESRFD